MADKTLIPGNVGDEKFRCRDRKQQQLKSANVNGTKGGYMGKAY